MSATELPQEIKKLSEEFNKIISEILGYSNKYYSEYLSYISASDDVFSAQNVVNCLVRLRNVFRVSSAFEEYINSNNISAADVQDNISPELAERCRRVASEITENEKEQRKRLNSAQDIEDDDEYMRVCQEARSSLKFCRSLSFAVAHLNEFADRITSDNEPAMMPAMIANVTETVLRPVSEPVNDHITNQQFEYVDPDHQQDLFEEIISAISDINDTEQLSIPNEPAQQDYTETEQIKLHLDSQDEITEPELNSTEVSDTNTGITNVPNSPVSVTAELPEATGQTSSGMITLCICGNVMVLSDPTEAFVQVCEYAIAKRPFMMSRMHRSDIRTKSGIPLFSRDSSTGKAMSNGLKTAELSSTDEFRSLTSKLLIFCGLPEDAVIIK